MVGPYCPECGIRRSGGERYCANCEFDYWRTAAGRSLDKPDATDQTQASIAESMVWVAQSLPVLVRDLPLGAHEQVAANQAIFAAANDRALNARTAVVRSASTLLVSSHADPIVDRAVRDWRVLPERCRDVFETLDTETRLDVIYALAVVAASVNQSTTPALVPPADLLVSGVFPLLRWFGFADAEVVQVPIGD